MEKIICVCGKICSGKSYYANKLKEKENAVILSCDEITKFLFNNDLGESHDDTLKRIKIYLLKKAEDIVLAGVCVILDWGFWSKDERTFINKYFLNKNINYEWHYIDIDDKSWAKNIEERNQKILKGDDVDDYYLDEGLIKKLTSKWEEPEKDEINVRFKLKR